MANTYTTIHIQIIFAVKFRAALIKSDWRNDLFKYIAGIISKQKHKLIVINGTADHLHVLIGLKPHQSLSDLVQDIKSGSSKWINEKKLTRTKFAWQEGYGAFSYSQSHLLKVIDYINNQEKHHKSVSFTDEYKKFLKLFKVDYDEKYVLKDPQE